MSSVTQHDPTLAEPRKQSTFGKLESRLRARQISNRLTTSAVRNG